MKRLTICLMMLIIFCAACSSPNAPGSSSDQLAVPDVEKPNKEKANNSVSDKDNNKDQDNEPKTIVFSTFFPDDFFKEAKQKYEALHPNITIELKSASPDEAELEENLEKFVKTTNTAMLSGNGPDVLEMDQLPTGQYISKKLLTNLDELIATDPDFKKEAYFSNVLDGLQQNGGLYGMPLRFFVQALIGNETAITQSGVDFDDRKWDWQQFAATAKELVKHTDDKHQFALNGTAEYVLNEMVNDQYAAFVDLQNGMATFDSPAFTALMEQVKTLFAENIITEKPELALFRRVSIVSPADYIREMKMSEFLTKGNAYQSKLYFKPNANGKHGGSYFRTYTTLGINERSKVKAEAWDFIKFMLSEEMADGKADSAGFPLNKAVYQKKTEQLLKEGKVKSDQPVGPMKDQQFPITANDIAALDKFVTGAIYPVEFKPSKIEEIILEEATAFFSGQKSADAVAKLIQNRVNTVLNE